MNYLLEARLRYLIHANKINKRHHYKYLIYKEKLS